MDRVAIIGTSCSGKSTLAAVISKQLDIPHIELDALHWKPNWVERPDGEFCKLVESEVSRPKWVIDGNYAVAREIVWPRATTIIWLDYSFPTVIFRALKRSVRRAFTKEKVCSGNTESFRQSFFSRNSVILWVIRTHKANRSKYNELLSSDQMKHFDIKIFASHQHLSSYFCSLDVEI
jgi:adenylate kinase family enzyme